jgi:hypothetical protein
MEVWVQEEEEDAVADTLIVANQLHDEEIAISDSGRDTKSSPSPTSPHKMSSPGTLSRNFMH